MAKPYVHALTSAKRWGGEPEDYIGIHELMDSSKQALADNRHRALTHNAWFIGFVLPRVFGETFVNSADRVVSTRDVGEQHVLEDFGERFIPTAQDYLQGIPYEKWMNNGREGAPASFRQIEGTTRQRFIEFGRD
jgi:hypothetical protein